jgi:hypothetical protein
MADSKYGDDKPGEEKKDGEKKDSPPSLPRSSSSSSSSSSSPSLANVLQRYKAANDELLHRMEEPANDDALAPALLGQWAACDESCTINAQAALACLMDTVTINEQGMPLWLPGLVYLILP